VASKEVPGPIVVLDADGKPQNGESPTVKDRRASTSTRAGRAPKRGR
jgi:hypothetical protein